MSSSGTSPPVPRPDPADVPQHLCLDRGYDFPEVALLVLEFGYTAHLPRRRADARRLHRSARKKARRWVVERSHSWLNRFRRLLVRWEKKAENFLAMLHLALGIITWRAALLPG